MLRRRGTLVRLWGKFNVNSFLCACFWNWLLGIARYVSNRFSDRAASGLFSLALVGSCFFVQRAVMKDHKQEVDGTLLREIVQELLA